MKEQQLTRWEVFRIKNPCQQPLLNSVCQKFINGVEKVFGIKEMDDIYQYLLDEDHSQRHFADKVLHYFQCTYALREGDLERIPKTGPVVVVANHPFGAIEGLLLVSLLSTVRPDFKVMANYLLGRMPELRPFFILVDPFGGRQATHLNSQPLRESLQLLRDGHLLATFPAGEVAHYELRRNAIVEAPWNETIGGIIRRTQAPVVPIYFEGTNSLSFHLAGLIHPRLRTLCLPRQLLRKEGQRFQIHIGNLISFKKLEKAPDIMAYLRMRTYNLGHRDKQEPITPPVLHFPGKKQKTPSDEEPIIPAIPPAELASEIDFLPPEQMLVRNNDLEVWYARAPQIPKTLQEIGRLREVTFRAVGEGTGKSIDLDDYDSYYLHLFLWNRADREVVGAYRVGPTDEILPNLGKKGLYTSSLFKYRQELLDQINPALEMGRTFVRESYQRNYNSLYLVWKGIAQFVVRYPRYKTLFGPVSINGNYQTSTRDLLIAFLKMNNYLPELAKLVKARRPPKPKLIKKFQNPEFRSVVENLDEVEALIADLETKLQGMPILLKQYLRLGGRILGFNIDPDFSYVLDGLILVDLTETDVKVLNHYMGQEGMKSFLAAHGCVPGRIKPEKNGTKE